MVIHPTDTKLALLVPEGYEAIGRDSEFYKEVSEALGIGGFDLLYRQTENANIHVWMYKTSPERAMTFGDTASVIDGIHKALGDDQGLIEVNAGRTPRGYDFIYSIVKTYNQETLSVNYFLRMNIGKGEDILELQGYFCEIGTTGLREAFALNLAMTGGLARIEDGDGGRRIAGWSEDPYDPDYDRGNPMNLAERKAFDGLFPSHCLSQAREFVVAVTEDCFYKTVDEIKAEHEDEEGTGESTEATTTDRSDAERAEENKEFIAKIFREGAIRKGKYHVDVPELVEPAIAEAGNPVGEFVGAAVKLAGNAGEAAVKAAGAVGGTATKVAGGIGEGAGRVLGEMGKSAAEVVDAAAKVAGDLGGAASSALRKIPRPKRENTNNKG